MSLEDMPQFFDEQVIERLRNKRMEFGPYIFTLEDHISMGSTPPDILKGNPGVPHYELLTEDERAKIITEYEVASDEAPSQYKDDVNEEMEATKRLFNLHD